MKPFTGNSNKSPAILTDSNQRFFRYEGFVFSSNPYSLIPGELQKQGNKQRA